MYVFIATDQLYNNFVNLYLYLYYVAQCQSRQKEIKIN